MARSFHRRQSVPPIADLNVIPLIDLAFSILIIFMIATPLIQNETTTPVNLPISTQANARDPNLQFVSITIVGGGGMYEMNGRRLDATELDRELAAYARSANPPVFSLRADLNRPIQELQDLFDLLQKHGLTKFSLDSQRAR